MLFCVGNSTDCLHWHSYSLPNTGQPEGLFFCHCRPQYRRTDQGCFLKPKVNTQRNGQSSTSSNMNFDCLSIPKVQDLQNFQSGNQRRCHAEIPGSSVAPEPKWPQHPHFVQPNSEAISSPAEQKMYMAFLGCPQSGNAM